MNRKQRRAQSQINTDIGAYMVAHNDLVRLLSRRIGDADARIDVLRAELDEERLSNRTLRTWVHDMIEVHGR